MIYLFTVITLGMIYILHPTVILAHIEADNIPTQYENIQEQSSCGDCIEKLKYSQMKNQPIIETNFGDIKGQTEMFNDEEVVVFYGIRYAKPPIDVLRFSKPEPMDMDTSELFGSQTKEKVACAQPKNVFIGDDLNVSEDCLHLNIWKPLTNGSAKDVNIDETPLLAVMIWIHGGSFHVGSANQDEYNGIVLASIGKVIVVTLNYRLGFFGFLNAEIESATGNMGLYDQATALKWVKENIHFFGGNPEEITLFGESAGGLSIALLSLSSTTRNLFKRAIIESGSPYSPLRPEPKAEAFKKSLMLSKALNCSSFDANEFTESAIKCLRDIDYKIIADYGQQDVMLNPILPNPIFGDEFVPDDVHTLMKNPENINKNLEVMLGINRDEGFVFVADQFSDFLDSMDSKIMTKDDVHSEVEQLLRGRSIDPVEVTNYYFQNMSSKGEDSMSVLNTIVDIYGDLYINCPVYFLANRYREILGYENTYSYMLTKASSQSLILSICQDLSKICHADEIVLIFGVPLRNTQQFDDTDRALSNYLLRIWTEFATTGKIQSIGIHPNSWFLELPVDDVLNFHPQKTYACEAFWRELFENRVVENGTSEIFIAYWIHMISFVCLFLTSGCY